MNILEKIVAHKRETIAQQQSLVPVKVLEKSLYFENQPISMRKRLLRDDQSGIIAEFKRKSPSEGVINDRAQVEVTTTGYNKAGASALSVLTDTPFFGGSQEDLLLARKYNYCPILRKDFMISEYQVIEAKSLGADTVLLIAAALKPQEVKSLARFTKSLGMEVLLEVHNEAELRDHITDEVDIVGVNNRNLGNFETAIQTSVDLADLIPDQFVKISESGINDPATIGTLRKYGYRGFLMGTYFMKFEQPEKACQEFIAQLKVASV